MRITPRFRSGALLVALLAAAILPGLAGAQVAHARFDVDSVGDSTFTFSVGSAVWVKRGQRGLAVDPSRGDALVAKFRVMVVRNDTATAEITGQTGRVARGQVALLQEPKARFYEQPAMWIAFGAGALIGYFAHQH
jgi:hypothetical protein